MGFVHNRKLLRLVFEGELEGLEVIVRPSSVLVYKRIAALANRSYSSPPSDDDMAALSGLYEAFAGVLVSWNLEEPEGVPVPATLDGVETQEPGFVNSLVTAWLDAAALTYRDQQLAAASAADLEESLPMEPLPGL